MTGATGYLGAHIVDLLLERGIVVVVTARSETKAQDFVERRSGFKDSLEMVVTGDLIAVGAFDDLAKDVDVIIHCASVSFFLCSLSCLMWDRSRTSSVLGSESLTRFTRLFRRPRRDLMLET